MRANFLWAKSQITIALLAMAIFAACPSRAQSAASAKSFLVFAYRHYQSCGKGIDFEGPQAALYLHSTLLALVRVDIKANGPGSAPAIDFDPICSCQDWKGVWGLKVDVQMETPKRALATVTFSLAPPKDHANDALRKLDLTLVPEHGTWRIYDIQDESDTSTTLALRKLLEDDIANVGHDSEPKANQ
jgi:hypothetical protein